MTDKIKDLPNDKFPISPEEKEIVEKFFNPIEESYDLEPYKLPVLCMSLFFILQMSCVKNLSANTFGDKGIYINTLIFGIIIYAFTKYY